MRRIDFKSAVVCALLIGSLSLARAEEHGAKGGGEGEKAKGEANSKSEKSEKSEKHEPEPLPEGMVERSAKQSSRDVKIPRILVARIEKEYREFLKKNQKPDQEALKRQMMNIAVDLRKKRGSALHEEVRINTPLGGGVIDLADFVTPLRGAFQLWIRPRAEDQAEIPALRVFFVSNAKSRILAGESFGAGCGKLMEVTSFFQKKMAGPGWELFTADQRYLSVVGGTFVLVAYSLEALQVGSVTFTDSRFPETLCE